MAADPLAGILCKAHPVLNAYEQKLYNVCEEYFVTIQRRSNRHCVLSQVRVVDAIKVTTSKPYIDGVQFTALSFDILVTDSVANPLFVFEADGPQHKVDPQLSRDIVKDAIARKADLKLFRLEVDGMLPPMVVLNAESRIPDFQRDLEYPTTDGWQNFVLGECADVHRTIEMADIEIRLIRAEWTFPSGWEFVTDYERRELA